MKFHVMQEPSFLGAKYEFRGAWRYDRDTRGSITGCGTQHTLCGKGYISNLMVQQVDDDSVSFPPFMTLRGDQAQQLMDAMWDANIRPSNGCGNNGEIARIEKHLADMRAIAMSKLNIRCG